MKFGTALSLVNVYIDLPNLGTPLDWEAEALEKAFDIIFTKARDIGRIGEIKAFADCKVLPYELRKRLLAKGVCVIDTPSLNNNGKGSDDQAMFLALAQLPFLYQNVETAIIVAGDGDYTMAVASLNQHGIEPVLMSTNGTSFALERAANGCEFIDVGQRIESNGNDEKNMKSKPAAETHNSQLEQAFEKLAEVLDEMRKQGYRRIPLNRIKSLLADSGGHPFDESKLKFSKFSDFIKAAEDRGLGKLICNGTTAYILI